MSQPFAQQKPEQALTDAETLFAGLEEIAQDYAARAKALESDDVLEFLFAACAGEAARLGGQYPHLVPKMPSASPGATLPRASGHGVGAGIHLVPADPTPGPHASHLGAEPAGTFLFIHDDEGSGP